MPEVATLPSRHELGDPKPHFRVGAHADFLDAFDDESEAEAGSTAVVSQLQEIVPIPLPANTSKLEDEASRHRVLLVRGGAVIAVTTIIAVGGALLLHAIFAGLIILGSLFPWFLGSPANSGGSGSATADDSPGGFSMLGVGPDDNAASSPLPVYVAGVPSAGALPTLKPLPETSSRDAAALLMLPASPELPANDLGSIRVAPPKSSVVPPAPLTATDSVSFAPPQVGTGTAAGAPGTPARGTASGIGGGTDDEPVFNWVKGSGSGSGRGSGAGNGIDRGMSAADRQPQLLNFASSGNSAFQLPMKYQLRPPEQSVKFIISIAADGSIAGVHMDQSCGVTDVDELAKAYILANLRFSPAYKAGKAVTADFPFELSFKPFD